MREKRTAAVVSLHTPARKAEIERTAAARDMTLSEFARQALYAAVRQQGAPAPAADEVA